MTPAQVANTMSPDLFPLLCQAWGESDRPFAFIAYTEAEVRKFIVNQWWGDETDERVDEVMSDLRGHDWKDEPEWHAEFEIGGVSFKPICESNSRAAVEAALRDAPQQVEVFCKKTPCLHISGLGKWGCNDCPPPSAPTAVEPEERAPLTVEQIEPLAASVIGYSALVPEEMKLFTDCVRAVESAHGIAARASKGTPL